MNSWTNSQLRPKSALKWSVERPWRMPTRPEEFPGRSFGKLQKRGGADELSS
jgi:hypothetical protein